MYELNLIHKTFRFDDCLFSFLQVTVCNYTDMFVLRVLFILMLLAVVVIEIATSERRAI
jgi:hypothetical protein